MSTPQYLDRRAQHLLQASRLFAKVRPELSSHLGHQLGEYIEQRSGAGPLHQSQQQSKRHSNLRPELCLACSSLQIPGLTCDLAVQRKKFKPHRETPARVKLTASKPGNSGGDSGDGISGNKAPLRRRPFGPQPARLKTTCRICRRFIQQPLHKPDDKKQASTQHTAGLQAAATATAVATASKRFDVGENATEPQDKLAAADTTASTIAVTPHAPPAAATSTSVQRKARQKQKKGGLAAMLAQSKAQSGKSTTTGSSLAFSDFARKA